MNTDPFQPESVKPQPLQNLQRPKDDADPVRVVFGMLAIVGGGIASLHLAAVYSLRQPAPQAQARPAPVVVASAAPAVRPKCPVMRAGAAGQARPAANRQACTP